MDEQFVIPIFIRNLYRFKIIRYTIYHTCRETRVTLQAQLIAEIV